MHAQPPAARRAGAKAAKAAADNCRTPPRGGVVEAGAAHHFEQRARRLRPRAVPQANGRGRVEAGVLVGRHAARVERLRDRHERVVALQDAQRIHGYF